MRAQVGRAPGGGGRGIRVDGRALRRDLDLRAMAPTELARRVGVSDGTIGSALAGRPISAPTLRGILKVLEEAPVVAAGLVFTGQVDAAGEAAS